MASDRRLNRAHARAREVVVNCLRRLRDHMRRGVAARGIFWAVALLVVGGAVGSLTVVDRGMSTAVPQPPMPSAPVPVAPPRPVRSAAESTAIAAERAPTIPIPATPEVRAALRMLLTVRAPSLADAFQRAADYGDRLRGIVRHAGLPEDVLGLAFLESGMNPQATSATQAAGLWQFVATTARQYGIRTTAWVDERRDPEKSTRAAAMYLRHLLRRFGSWPLALAAYHAGETAIQRAVRAHQTIDLWRLPLPSETARLVAADFAMMVIGREPERFGFRPPAAPPADTPMVEVPGGMPFQVLSGMLATPLETLQDLNPELVRAVTPPGVPYQLRIPRRREREGPRPLPGDPGARPADPRGP